MNKKTLISIIVLLILVIAGILAWIFWPKDLGWKTYTNDQYGYEIQYPSSLLGLNMTDPCEVYAHEEDYSSTLLTDNDAIQFAYQIYSPGLESFPFEDIKYIYFEICRINDNYKDLAYYAEDRGGEMQQLMFGKNNAVLVHMIGEKGTYHNMDSYFLEIDENMTIVLRYNYDAGINGDVPYLKNWQEKYLFENQKDIFDQMLSTFKFINQ
ncbi:MAG: hypothetical protein WC309_03090 [Candidatus Paceibacterota bacterium]|jgi:hypothetical protein